MDNSQNNDHDELFDFEKEPVSDPATSSPQSGKEASRKKKSSRRVIAVLLAIFIAIVAFFGGFLTFYYSLDEELRTFLWALDISERNYYRNIDKAELYERLYGLLDLDDYSQIFSPKEYEDYQLEGQGQNVGIGISLMEEREGDPIRLFLVVGDSPAERAGLRKGMYLLGFGETEEDLKAGSSADFTAFVSEQSGEFVLRCGYQATGEDAKNYRLKREKYQASYCHYRDSETSFRFRYDYVGSVLKTDFSETHEPLSDLDQKTAYIRIDEFSGNAAEEFVQCLSKMKERGRSDLILDLRSNGGGYLDILTAIAAYLLKNADGKTPVVAKAVYRDGKESLYRTNRNEYSSYFSSDSRVCLLADEYTASASECLIGALVDYGTVSFEDIYLRENERGVAKSFGKGIMQSHYQSLSGAAMKLTVAEMRWPVSNKSIHGIGVTPADGATPIPADLIFSKDDPLLEEVIARVCQRA